MLSRIQVKATGLTAHSVEEELRDAAAKIAHALGLELEVTDQLIEGSPGRGFAGRLSMMATDDAARARSAAPAARRS